MFQNVQTKNIKFYNDGISIRTLKEHQEYTKSPKYQKILMDLKELSEKRKRGRKEYNARRYKLEQNIRDLTFIDGDLSTNFQPIRNDSIPKITLTSTGKIILQSDKENLI
ncbi:MAG: hypothetical protein HWN66_16800 [Candidatus Helarchaeota archaeon]|nr:hypothetical protein [Candidatus Helarchaeota archaeon]